MLFIRYEGNFYLWLTTWLTNEMGNNLVLHICNLAQHPSSLANRWFFLSLTWLGCWTFGRVTHKTDGSVPLPLQSLKKCIQADEAWSFRIRITLPYPHPHPSNFKFTPCWGVGAGPSSWWGTWGGTAWEATSSHLSRLQAGHDAAKFGITGNCMVDYDCQSNM